MAGSVNFTGLASGLNTSQIIEDLMAIDSQPLKRLENQKTENNTQRDTFTSMKSGLLDLKTSLEDIRTATSFGLFNAAASDEDAIGVSASASASEGNYTLRILALAQAETLSGNSYEEATSDLGLTGEILINNESLKIRSTDSLTDIRNAINALDSGVSASILKVTSTDYRLIISAKSQGAEGFNISNVGSADTLSQLGFTDGTSSVRSIVNGDVRSTLFTSSSSTIASLTGITSQASGLVTIAGSQVEIDLDSDSLTSVRDKINNLALPGVSAEVQSVETDGETRSPPVNTRHQFVCRQQPCAGVTRHSRRREYGHSRTLCYERSIVSEERESGGDRECRIDRPRSGIRRKHQYYRYR